MTLIDAARSRLSAIAFGVTLGILGRYGLAMEDGRAPKRRDLVVDALTFGILMLVTIQLADELRLERGGCVMTGAGVGICGTRVVRWFRDRFFSQLAVDPQVKQLADAARAADISKVPAGSGVPDEIGAHSGTPDNSRARAGAALQGAFRRPTITRPPLDMIEQLRRMDPPTE